MTLYGIAAFAALVSGFAYSATPNHQNNAAQSKPDPIDVEVSLTDIGGIRTADRVYVMPSPRVVLVSRVSSNPYAVLPKGDALDIIDTECVNAKRRQCVIELFHPDGMRLLSRGADNTIFLLKGRSQIIHARVWAGTSAIYEPIEVQAIDKDIADLVATIDFTKSQSIRQELLKADQVMRAAFKINPSGFVLVGVYIDSSYGYVSIHERISDLRLYLNINGRLTETELIRPYAAIISIHSLNGKVLVEAPMGLLSAGWNDPLQSGPLFSQSSTLDYGQGSFLKEFDEVGRGHPRMCLRAATQTIAFSRSIFQNIATGDFAEPECQYAFIAKDDKEQSFVVSTGITVPAKIGTTPENFHKKVHTFSLRSGNWSLEVTYCTFSKKRPTSAVLYFGGGPAKLRESSISSLSVRKWLDRGRDVFIVHYSGNQGRGDVGRRLATNGLEAFQHDSAALLSANLLKKYRAFIVVGESLGALPAIDFASKMPKNMAGMILIAPLLKHRDPTEWAEQTGFDAVNIDYQKRFELATLGPEIVSGVNVLDFSARLLQRTYARNVPILAVFGSLDKVSTAQDIGDLCTNVACVTVAASHGLTGAVPGTWEKIDTFSSRLLP